MWCDTFYVHHGIRLLGRRRTTAREKDQGNDTGKDLRLSFIAKVLTLLNFTCAQTGELLDTRLMRYDKKLTADCLNQVGRLLGAVRLPDMVLTNESMLTPMVDAFFQGKYDFSNE